MITIIQEARTPAMTNALTTIHLNPMTPTPMTAAVDVIAVEEVMGAAGAEEGIDSGARIRFGIDFP